MRRILAIILVLLFVFAFIRIATSTYENKKRRDDSQIFSGYNKGILVSAEKEIKL